MPQALSQVLRQEIWQQRGKGAEIGAIAEVLGISRRSVTRILARGVRGLKPSYDRCGRNGREYREGVRTAAVALKRAHPGWGAVVIQLELAQEFGKTERLPGERTLQSWFRRAGVAVRRERKPAETRPRGQWVHEAEAGIVQRGARLLLPPIVARQIDRLQHAEEPAISRMLADDDIFQRVQMRHQPHILERARDPVVSTRRLEEACVMSAPSTRTEPRSTGIDAGDQIEHRGLAGSVRPDQRGARATTDVERQIVDH